MLANLVTVSLNLIQVPDYFKINPVSFVVCLFILLVWIFFCQARVNKVFRMSE